MGRKKSGREPKRSVAYRLDPEMIEAVKAYADEHQLYPAEVVRMALARLLGDAAG